jgi:coenzyme F420-0:L-glutamate ligase/coenzyme F420-1:gamma-L-glutamate ligase
LISVIPFTGIPEIGPGDDVAAAVGVAARRSAGGLQDGDIVVIASKILSKAEGRLVSPPPPGLEAERLAGVTGLPAADVQLVLDQSRSVLRAAPGVLVVETTHGFVCANAGVDRSNAAGGEQALLLPVDPDAWAAQLRGQWETEFGCRLAVLVSDSFGRPFRLGQVNIALGLSGMAPIRDYRGLRDPAGYLLKGTELAVADELCSAAELVMNKLDRVPAAVVRGYPLDGDGSGRDLLRPAAEDLFR